MIDLATINLFGCVSDCCCGVILELTNITSAYQWLLSNYLKIGHFLSLPSALSMRRFKMSSIESPNYDYHVTNKRALSYRSTTKA
jgi:hypothetical protein